MRERRVEWAHQTVRLVEPQAGWDLLCDRLG